MRRGKMIFAGLLFALAGCGLDLIPLRLQGPMQLNPSARVVIRDGQLYATRGGQDLRYDLFMPMGAAGPLPIVILVHGGSWRTGSRVDMLEWGYDLAANGFAAAAIDYRLARDGVVYPAPVSDVLAAIRFFRDQSATLGVDPQRMALFGISAGAHLSLLSGLTQDASVFDPERPAGETPGVTCIVDLFGAADFTVDPATADAGQVSRVENFLGTTLAGAGDLLRQASPVSYVRTDGPPVLVIHGDADGLVPVAQSRRLVERMIELGQAHTYLEIPGMDHVPGAIWQGCYAQGYRVTIFEFLRERL